MPNLETYRVAIAQIAPVYHNKAASLTLALEIIAQAAARGAQLVVFGETWFPGYPVWLDVCPTAGLWNHEPTKRVFAELRRNSLVVGGAETQALADACRQHKLGMMLGCNERVDRGPGNGTLFNSLLTFSAAGELVNHHRKLMPTYTERIVWGQGDGSGLESVRLDAGAESPRVGGLICWEHWMPLARMAMHQAGEALHVAVWPTANDKAQLASRHYAREGRCFVLAAGLMMRTADLPSELPHTVTDEWVERGGSAIIAPDGSYVVEPMYDREELIVADLDLNMIDRETMSLDVTGHYARPDVFQFSCKALSPG